MNNNTKSRPPSRISKVLATAVAASLLSAAPLATAQISGVRGPASLTDEVRNAHINYLRSNGITGTITMVTGKRYELLRLGTPTRNIDYRLGNSVRFLREVAHARQTRADGKVSWTITYRDGSTAPSDEFVDNFYLQADNRDPQSLYLSAGGGIGSTHIMVVIRLAPGEEPILARLNRPDIAEMTFNEIDASPLRPITVRSVPTEGERAGWMRRWQAAADRRTGFDLPAELSFFNNSLCGWGAAPEPMEITYFCTARKQEIETAKRNGRLTPQTTPLLLSGMGPHDINGRSVF